MSTNVPDGQQRFELPRIADNLGGQVEAFADAGGREPERVGELEQTTRSIQEAVENLAQRQGAGAGSPRGHFAYNAIVNNNVMPESLTNKTGFK